MECHLQNNRVQISFFPFLLKERVQREHRWAVKRINDTRYVCVRCSSKQWERPVRVGRWWYIEPPYSESFYYNTGLTLLFLRQTLPCCVIRVNAREHRDKRSRFFRSFLQNAQFSGTSPETIFFSFFLFFFFGNKSHAVCNGCTRMDVLSSNIVNSDKLSFLFDM